MNIDHLAAAIDWFDAYAAGDIDTIVAMYAGYGILDCRCGAGARLAGPDAIRAYWALRLVEYPAPVMKDLTLVGDRVSIVYATAGSAVRVELKFNENGAIEHATCGPLQ